MRTLVIQGKSIYWPRACACCLAPATRQIASQQTKTTFLVVASYQRTMSVQIPYCEECGRRVQASLGMTPWVKALLVFIGLFFAGAFVNAFFMVALKAFPAVSGVVGMFVFCGMPFVGTFFYVRHQRRQKPEPLPHPHMCNGAHTVMVSDFGKDSVTLRISNDHFAEAMQAANPGSATRR